MRIVTFRWEQDAMAVAGVRVIRHPDETPGADGEMVWSWRRDPGVHPCRPVPAGQRGQERPFPVESAYKP